MTSRAFDRSTIQPGDVLQLTGPVPIGKHPGAPSHMDASEVLDAAASLRKTAPGAVYDVIEIRREHGLATWIRVNDGWINAVSFLAERCRPMVRYE